MQRNCQPLAPVMPIIDAGEVMLLRGCVAWFGTLQGCERFRSFNKFSHHVVRNTRDEEADK